MTFSANYLKRFAFLAPISCQIMHKTCILGGNEIALSVELVAEVVAHGRVQNYFECYVTLFFFINFYVSFLGL